MKTPKNMSDSDVLEIINTVIDRIAPKYVVSGYEIDDIKQESFIICMDALNRYDEKRPLENFLSVHLSNRLKNFIRDNLGNSKHEKKKKVKSPSTIENLSDTAIGYYEFDPSSIDEKNIFNIIDSNIPIHMRSDFLKFINNVYINKTKKIALLDKMKEILNEKRQDI